VYFVQYRDKESLSVSLVRFSCAWDVPPLDLQIAHPNARGALIVELAVQKLGAYGGQAETSTKGAGKNSSNATQVQTQH
jgi:hypothetical protein